MRERITGWKEGRKIEKIIGKTIEKIIERKIYRREVNRSLEYNYHWQK